MNSYNLSRNFWNWAFENPDQIKPTHAALYFFCIEHCNRLGWKEKFGLPTTMAKEAIGVRSYNTYVKALSELVEFGFIKMVEKSKNQYSSNIIALSNFDKAHNKALDKALIKHTTKQGESIDSIDKQETNKQETTYLSGGHLSITLEDFNKLAEAYGNETAEEYCHSVLNWAKNSKVKSLYLTALKWIKRDNVKRLGEPKKKLTELEKLEAHKAKARKEAGWD